MKAEEKIPFGISDYIQQKFREEFLFEVKDIREIDGRKIYVVEVSKDDYIHTLEFNEDGTLLKEEAKEAFPPDIHEEGTFGEVPE